MQREEILERERRLAKPTAITGFVALALYLTSVVITASTLAAKGDANQLTKLHDNLGLLLVTSILGSIGAVLLSVPLLYLFRAAQARSDRVRAGMVIFAIVGPVFLAVQTIVSWAAQRDAANAFVNHTLARCEHGKVAENADRMARCVIDHTQLLTTARGLFFPAVLGLIVAMIYIPLYAMRTGLIARVWSTLGMILGAALVIIPLALFGVFLWFGYISALISGRLPGGRPPAWAAGKAIPWPPPGEKQAPGTVEGRGELSSGSDDDETTGAPTSSNGGNSGQRRRKRKRRK